MIAVADMTRDDLRDAYLSGRLDACDYVAELDRRDRPVDEIAAARLRRDLAGNNDHSVLADRLRRS